MREIAEEFWQKFGGENNYHFPQSVRMRCENCSVFGVVSLAGAVTNAHAGIRSALGNCPACEIGIQFVLLYSLDSIASGASRPVVMYATGLAEDHLRSSSISDAVGDRVKGAFSAAVSAYNSGRMSEASNQTRRALEGAMKKALNGKSIDTTARKPTLHQLIDSVAQQIELAAPLKRLAILAKDAGNLGSHLDDEEPAADLVKEQILATYQIISFIFELPETIDRMEFKLKKTP